MSTWPHRPKGEQCSTFLSRSLEKELKSAFFSSPDSMQPLYLCHWQPSQIQPILKSLLKLSPWVYLCVFLWVVCRTLKKSCIKETFMASIFSSVFFCFLSFLFSLSCLSSLSFVLDSSLLCNQGFPQHKLSHPPTMTVTLALRLQFSHLSFQSDSISNI